MNKLYLTEVEILWGVLGILSAFVIGFFYGNVLSYKRNKSKVEDRIKRSMGDFEKIKSAYNGKTIFIMNDSLFRVLGLCRIGHKYLIEDFKYPIKKMPDKILGCNYFIISEQDSIKYQKYIKSKANE